MTTFLSLRLAATLRDNDIIQEPYNSCRLNSQADSTRLLTIDPMPDLNGRIVCHLHVARFVERPRFTALSYRWGDDTNNQTILVNGHEISITSNLYDALEYLRDALPDEKLWIDAIVINQADIPEKNYQLFILPDIYKRAKGVVSWLSKEYSHLRIDTSLLTKAPSDMEIRRKIHADQYWERAWVLQEVGKARNVQLCIGPELLDWDDFLPWVVYGMTETLEEMGPVRFEELRRGKFTLSMQLKRLIEDYGNYKCKDPRDKIYSLVGLSSDGANLPMDYGRDLIDVWSDVISYLWNNDTLTSGTSGYIDFCRKVRASLGWDKLPSPTGIISFENAENDKTEYNDESDTIQIQSPPLIWLKTYIVGTIVSLGPSPLEIATSIEISRNWEQHLYETFNGRCTDMPESIARENEPLINTILNSKDGRLTPTCSFKTWRVDQITRDKHARGTRYLREDGEPVNHPKLRHTWTHQTTTPGEPRLAILKHGYCGQWDLSTRDKIALVPAEAQVGDRMVCAITSDLKLLMCRPYDIGVDHKCKLHLYGTAKTAHQICGRREPPWGTEYTHIAYMHPKTFYALMFDDLERNKKKRSN